MVNSFFLVTFHTRLQNAHKISLWDSRGCLPVHVFKLNQGNSLTTLQSAAFEIATVQFQKLLTFFCE